MPSPRPAPHERHCWSHDSDPSDQHIDFAGNGLERASVLVGFPGLWGVSCVTVVPPFFFTPVDEEHTEVHCMLTMRKMPMPFANSILLRKAIGEGKKTIDQDVPIWENKVYRERPGLCEADGPIMQYRRWASQFYAAQ